MGCRQTGIETERQRGKEHGFACAKENMLLMQMQMRWMQMMMMRLMVEMQVLPLPLSSGGHELLSQLLEYNPDR